jgi:replication-associated recombination protein RarA
MKTTTDLRYRCISYPEFEPNHTWLRKMLLFVDEVHRIVPRDYPLMTPTTSSG